jgi:hypothetical protein
MRGCQGVIRSVVKHVYIDIKRSKALIAFPRLEIRVQPYPSEKVIQQPCISEQKLFGEIITTLLL